MAAGKCPIQSHPPSLFRIPPTLTCQRAPGHTGLFKHTDSLVPSHLLFESIPLGLQFSPLTRVTTDFHVTETSGFFPVLLQLTSVQLLTHLTTHSVMKHSSNDFHDTITSFLFTSLAVPLHVTLRSQDLVPHPLPSPL